MQRTLNSSASAAARAVAPVAAGLTRCLALAMCLLSGACGGGGTPATALLHPGPAAVQPPQAPALVRTSSGFTLRVLPQSFEGGASVGDMMLDVHTSAAETVVTVSVADARALKGLYFELAYDPAQYDPLAAEATGALAATSTAMSTGVGDDRTLSLSVLSQPGLATLGQMLTNPDTQPGLSGDAVVARLRFAARPFTLRQASLAPVSVRSAPSLLLDADTRALSWRFYSQGDYDQNGETNIADLQPIGAHWHAATGGGPFPPATAESAADGDDNGEINIADLQPIGLNYKRTLAGYHVYTSASLADWPATPTVASTAAPLDTVPLASATGDAHHDRLAFTDTPAGLADGAYVWVRGFDGASEGTPSNAVQYTPPNLKPLAALSANSTGGGVPLLVTLDASASHDPDGSIVKYEFDWDGTAGPGGWTANGSLATAQHEYDTPGTYTPTVRVTDDRGATATASLAAPLTVLAHVNQAPHAVLTATPSGGKPGLTVQFDASGSSDSDGTLVQVDWDWDGDGVYDDGGNNLTPAHLYSAVGTYMATVRVRDDGGLTATASRKITVSNNAIPPSADLKADVDHGVAPLTVTFDGSASQDPDGVITKYEWDWNYSGFTFHPDLDTGATPTAQHVFAAPGSYRIAMRVTDLVGLTDEGSMVINTFNSGPTAHLTATPRYGPVPLNVSFDASASQDYDATITQYDWDWDGDGTFDATGTAPTDQHVYATAGVYNALVRVTDSNNHQSTKLMLVLATADASFPPDDCIFALPSQSTAHDGDVVTIEVYTKGAASGFQYMNGCGLTLEHANTYQPLSFNYGAIDYNLLNDGIDGVWTLVNPSGGFVDVPDNFIEPTDVGGGRDRLDFNVTTVGGTEVPSATGAMFNFGLVVHSSVSFGFERGTTIHRTYYSGAGFADDLWGNDDNAGLPGITLQ